MIGRVLIAAALCGVLGYEREIRQKSAGLRTYALVGIGSALFMVVSEGGFTGVMHKDSVVLDPSRSAAQMASGTGFLGADLIIFRQNCVHGLAAAAGLCVSAAIGLACGGGLFLTACTVAVLTLGLMVFSARFIDRGVNDESVLPSANSPNTIRRSGAKRRREG